MQDVTHDIILKLIDTELHNQATDNWAPQSITVSYK